MDILNLKKALFTGVMLVILPAMAGAQDFKATRDAFQESYIKEATGDF